MDKDKARSEIEKLVVKYNKVVEDNRVKKYNEEMTKIGFIQPLFRALGWNIEDSREVTAEEKISKGRVDYGFRIDGISKFFLEAKSLKMDLDKEEYFEQAISYAWHKGCTWAVLTDFEEIKVLNAEVKAANYMQSRFIAIKCNDFLDRFDELWLLSKESFEKGLLDKKAEKWGKKTKKASIDKQLLADFTRFRSMLSKSITKLNQSKNLTEDELDEAVQRILDRLIFIRNCEDRELEQKLLISKLREWKSKGRGKFVKSLREVFDYFDEEYNSKIFSEHLCDSLEIDNEVISEIIRGLYHIKEKYFAISYDFSVIDADVLGNIYEQYLSHILKKTAKRAKVTKNGQHRKQQGIYYTPTYIVDYIVRNTLGKILENKRINVEKIRVLDPACGSGSFLIKAFDVMNGYFKEKIKDYTQAQLDLVTNIPFTKKAKIIQDNLFGVDLDKQAVEIAQLNLLLKIAEKGHRLPLLEQNIKSGNSLIGNEEIAGTKAFNWNVEFKEIMDENGFDVVIGNPPYIRNTELSDEHKEFFNEKYTSAYGQYDIFVLFFEIGIKLLKNNGYLGFITSNKFIASDYGKKLREFILKNCKIKSLIDVSYLRVFKEASTYPVIIILQKEKDDNRRKKNLIRFQKIEEINALDSISGIVEIKLLEYVGSEKFQIIKKIETNCNQIGEVFVCKRGSPKNKIKVINAKAKNSLPCIISRNVDRYSFKVSEDIFVVSDLQKNILAQNKILLPRTVLSLKVAYDEGNHFIMDRIYYLIPKESEKVSLKFVTGLLNSKLIDFYYKVNFGTTHVGGGYLDLRGVQIKQIPIKITSQNEQHPIIKLVNKRIFLGKQLDEFGEKITDERARIEKEIEKIDRQIDELVYKVYGITEKEQRIIEGKM